MSAAKAFTQRRIGVCGSSKELQPEAVPFCKAIGAHLARQGFVVVVSGGTKRRKSARPGDLAADWHIVDAARAVIESAAGASDAPHVLGDRIETVLSRTESSEAFLVGTVLYPRGKTSTARRFSFVRSIDALIAVGGGGGTGQELALAHELDKPVLPIPFFGGAAEEFWSAYRGDLIEALHIDQARAQSWETRGAKRTAVEAPRLAAEMVDALLRSLPRRCFVVMPFGEDFAAHFDFVIGPAVEAVGDHPIRLDRAGIPGDVMKQVHEGLAACEYAVVVLDGMRPNVLYELGLAHGRGKPTILLNRKGLADTIPFDIAPHQRIVYDALDATLLGRLRAAIEQLPLREPAARRAHSGTAPRDRTS